MKTLVALLILSLLVPAAAVAESAKLDWETGEGKSYAIPALEVSGFILCHVYLPSFEAAVARCGSGVRLAFRPTFARLDFGPDGACVGAALEEFTSPETV